MIEEPNGVSGEPRQLPGLTVAWDEAMQRTRFSFDPHQFKTWEFICGVLQMAIKDAEFNLNVSRMTAMQEQQREVAQAQALRNTLKF